MKYDKRALRRLRTEKGLTRDEVARLAKLGSRTIYYLDKGMTSPRADTLARLATGLGVSVTAFFVDAA